MPASSIACVVPVYNRPKVVIEALESIAAQTLPPAQLVVVDDGSKDDTADQIEAWLARKNSPSPPRLVRKPNGGVSTARNLGVTVAGACDLVAFLDSDDLWPPDYLERVGGALTQHPEAVAACVDQINSDFKANQTSVRNNSPYQGKVTAWLMEHGPSGTSNTIFRMDIFKRLEGFDVSIFTGQDLHFMLRASLLGPWLYVPGPGVTYRHEYATSKGEAGALSHAYPDRRVIRARTMERFILHEGGKDALPPQVWKAKLGQLWAKAGRQCCELGRRQEALDCFRASVSYTPWNLRSRWSLLTMKLF